MLTSAHAGGAATAALHAARTALGDVEQRTITTRDELEAALDAVDGRTLVVAGGDGSLHLTVARLHARRELAQTPLGLVPLGTGNGFARTLGIPLDPTAAAQLIVREQPRRLDLLVDDGGGIVVNAVRVGVGAEAAEHAGRLTSRLGPAAYPIGAVAGGLRATGWRLRVEVDGRVVADNHKRTLPVAIGNGRGLGGVRGGGTPLLPHAEPDDGLLDVVVSQATGPLARVRFGAALAKGEQLSDRAVRSARGTTVTVVGEQVEVSVDGETGDALRRRKGSVEPGAWSLVRPARPSLAIFCGCRCQSTRRCVAGEWQSQETDRGGVRTLERWRASPGSTWRSGRRTGCSRRRPRRSPRCPVRSPG